VSSGKLLLAAMCLRKVRVVGRSFAAALAHASKVVTPPTPAAHNLGVDLQRLCRGQMLSRRRTTRECYWLYLYSGMLSLAAIYFR
jgi:hypothetical protein